jgi:hypothetical protein
MDGSEMHRRGLYALVLGAFLAKVVLPAFHFHEEGGRRGECHHEAGHHAAGPAADVPHEDCAVCELLAVKVPGLAPEPPLSIGRSLPASDESAHVSLPTPRAPLFSLAGAPRGPPLSSPA